MLTGKEFAWTYSPPLISHSVDCLPLILFSISMVVMHWKGEPKSHYISFVVAVAAESHYSFLTVSKRAAELGCISSPTLSHHAPLAGNCLILQQAGGETAATPMHVSLSELKAWVGVGFGVTHECWLGSSRGALPKGGKVRQCSRSWTLVVYSGERFSEFGGCLDWIRLTVERLWILGHWCVL